MYRSCIDEEKDTIKKIFSIHVILETWIQLKLQVSSLKLESWIFKFQVSNFKFRQMRFWVRYISRTVYSMELKFSMDLYTSKAYTLNKFQLEQLNSCHSMDCSNGGENQCFAYLWQLISLNILAECPNQSNAWYLHYWLQYWFEHKVYTLFSHE